MSLFDGKFTEEDNDDDPAFYRTICRPITPYTRRRPVYEVVISERVSSRVRPRAIIKRMGLRWIEIPTDRIIPKGAVINPTREVKRTL